jgi:2-polyprenyl-6-methoxyphenol hydroxylase-like FAD-dependent oxidoreductase
MEWRLVIRFDMDSISLKTIHTRCCIAGGGPAGIMLGYLLARSGIDVIVLEKWPDFFRDFRGDTIHPSTMQVLHELGILEDFLKLPHQKTRQIHGYIGGEEIIFADFSYLKVRCPYIAFVPQWDFLNFIAEQAKRYSSFHLYMETETTDILEERGRVVGVRAKSPTGEIEIRAELIVGADGRHSTVREKAGMVGDTFGVPIDVLWFRLSRSGIDNEQSFGYIDSGKMFAVLDRGDYWQIARIIRKGDFEDIKTRGFVSFQRDLAELGPSFASVAHEIDSWDKVKFLSVTIDRLKQWARPGLLMIGDAAHAMSPMGGVGINLAIQDAVAAGNILIPAFKRGVPTIDDVCAVQRRREFPTRITQRFQMMIQDNVIKSVLARESRIALPWQLRFLKWLPFLRAIPAYVVGIGVRPEHVHTRDVSHR